ncbi:hypothetical protein BKH30_12640 [Actinomyces oris]|uniref:Uncharacterized protein n=1 Tax=Actinomyces oris TaxID=544580 RepID=A0A1Q8VEK6_9ACTO|nr:hypothetical protein BKH30_12640 [Actinomyces oris]
MSPRPEALFLHDGVGRLLAWEVADAVLRLHSGSGAYVQSPGRARGLHEPSTGVSAHGSRDAVLATVKSSVEHRMGAGVEKPVVPVLVSPSHKDGDNLSVSRQIRMRLSCS